MPKVQRKDVGRSEEGALLQLGVDVVPDPGALLRGLPVVLEGGNGRRLRGVVGWEPKFDTVRKQFV